MVSTRTSDNVFGDSSHSDDEPTQTSTSEELVDGHPFALTVACPRDACALAKGVAPTNHGEDQSIDVFIGEQVEHIDFGFTDLTTSETRTVRRRSSSMASSSRGAVPRRPARCRAVTRRS